MPIWFLAVVNVWTQLREVRDQKGRGICALRRGTEDTRWGQRLAFPVISRSIKERDKPSRSLKPPTPSPLRRGGSFAVEETRSDGMRHLG